MAAFNYTGNARIVWKDKPETVQFIGQMRDHPAVQIVFLH